MSSFIANFKNRLRKITKTNRSNGLEKEFSSKAINCLGKEAHQTSKCCSCAAFEREGILKTVNSENNFNAFQYNWHEDPLLSKVGNTNKKDLTERDVGHVNKTFDYVPRSDAIENINSCNKDKALRELVRSTRRRSDCVWTKSDNNIQVIGGAELPDEVVFLPSFEPEYLTNELKMLKGAFKWYHGPKSRKDTEQILLTEGDGSFLVRDSLGSKKDPKSIDSFPLSLSFVIGNKILHGRIRYQNEKFFLHSKDIHDQNCSSVVDLIRQSMLYPTLCFGGRSENKDSDSGLHLKLTNPVLRNTRVQSLQELCGFVIRLFITREAAEFMVNEISRSF